MTEYDKARRRLYILIGGSLLILLLMIITLEIDKGLRVSPNMEDRIYVVDSPSGYPVTCFVERGSGDMSCVRK